MPIALLLGMAGCALGLHGLVECDKHGSEQREAVVEHSEMPAQRQGGPVSIEIHTQTGHIVMPVWIEGNGPHWFVLDTGNQNTTFYAHLGEKLGLDMQPLGEMGGAGSGSITVQMASDVRVGLGEDGEELGFVDRQVTILPDAAKLPAFGDKEIAGFLGATTIEQFVTCIDYAEDELMFTPHDQYELPTDAQTMELKLAFGFPYFEGTVVPRLFGKSIDAIVGNFLLDLGDSMGVGIEYAQADAAGLLDSDDSEQRVIGSGQGIDGVRFELKASPAESIVMGGMSMDDHEIHFATTPGGGPPIPNLVGTVGSGSFSGQVVTLDYQGGRLILTN